MRVPPTDPIAAPLRTLFGAGSMAGLSDGELLDRFGTGAEPASSAAFEAIVWRHGPMVVRRCRRLLESNDSADDAAQAVFLILARKARSIRRRESAASWLYAVAGRVARRARAAEQRRREAERRRAAMQPIEPRPDAEGWSDLYDELDRLPDSLRAPVVLCYLEGRTNEHAAATLRVPLRTLRRRLAQARDRLRERLTTRGAAPAVALLESDSTRPLDLAAPWVERTVRSAAGFASSSAGPATAAVTLAQEVLRAMTAAQLRLATVAVLGVMTIGLGAIPVVAALRPSPTPEAAPPQEAPPPRVADLRPKSIDGTPLPAFLTDRPRTGPGKVTHLRVVSAATGEPVPHATVRVWKAFLDDWFTTDAEGRLDIEHSTGPADDGFGVDLWGDGYAQQRHDFYTDNGEVIPEDLTVKLQPGEKLGGLVTDEQGRPVAGATVYLWSHNCKKKDKAELLYDLRATTGPDGRWSTTGAPETTGDILRLDITHPDYVSDPGYDDRREKPPIDRLRDGTAVSIMKKGAYIEGRVLDADGRPVPGAVVAPVGDKDVDAALSFASISGADGRYRTAQLQPGDYEVVVFAQGHALTATATVSLQTAVPFVEVRLDRSSLLRVRLTDSQGAPIPDAFVSVDRWNGFRFPRIYRWTDADGRIEWGDAPPGRVGLNVQAFGHVGFYDRQAETGGDLVEFTLSPSIAVHGRVRDAATDKAIDSARVEVGAFNSTTGEVAEWADIPQDQAGVSRGRFFINFPVEADLYKFRIVAPGYATFLSRPLARADKVIRDYEVRLAEPAGDSPVGKARFADGTPLADSPFRVFFDAAGGSMTNGAFYDNGNASLNVPDSKGPRTAADGTFAVPESDKPYLLVIVGEGGYAIATKADLVESNEVRALPFSRITGRAFDGDRPVAGTSVSVSGEYRVARPQQISFSASAQVTTDAEGRFSFDRVIATPYLRVSRFNDTDGPGRRYDSGEMVSLEPGGTRDVQLGGRGRPVVGRLAPPADWSAPIDFTQATVELTTPRPSVPYPLSLARGRTTADWSVWTDWYNEWIESGAYLDDWRQDRRISLKGLAPDGSFRIDDVRSGPYNLTIEPEGRLGPQAEAPLAHIIVPITIPEMPGGRTDEPLDLGTIMLQRRFALQPGQPAPPFEVTTTTGDVVRVPGDFAGKYLLLDFDTMWDGAVAIQAVRANGFFEKYGKREDVAFLSLLAAADSAESRRFIDDKGQLWPQAIIGAATNPITTAYGFEDALSRFVLIGPNGSIVNLDSYDLEVGAALSEAFGDDTP